MAPLHHTSADLFHQWEDGTIDERSPLAALLAELATAEAHIKQWEGQRALLRNRIQTIVASLPGWRYALPGVADVVISDGFVVASYNRAQLDTLVREMLASGEISAAQAIQAARSERVQPGSLRISRVAVSGRRAPADTGTD